MRAVLKKASELQWNGQAASLMAGAEHLSPPWNILLGMIGVSGGSAELIADLSVLPLRFEALPTSAKGRSALEDLKNVCEVLLPKLTKALAVATLKGRSERACVLSWIRLTRYRSAALEFLLGLLTVGVSPNIDNEKWHASVRPQFTTLLSTMAEYENVHNGMQEKPAEEAKNH